MLPNYLCTETISALLSNWNNISDGDVKAIKSLVNTTIDISDMVYVQVIPTTMDWKFHIKLYTKEKTFLKEIIVSTEDETCKANNCDFMEDYGLTLQNILLNDKI